MFGDLEEAMLVARLLEQPGKAFASEVLFLPELLTLRRHPEFPDLVTKPGVQEYRDAADCIWSAATVRCSEFLARQLNVATRTRRTGYPGEDAAVSSRPGLVIVNH